MVHSKPNFPLPRRSWNIRRFHGAVVPLCLLLGALGCQTDPRARREIALLKAELIALEDRYAALRSRCAADGETFAEDVSIEAPAVAPDYTPSTTPPPSTSPTTPQTPPAKRSPPEELDLFIEDPQPPPRNGNGDNNVGNGNRRRSNPNIQSAISAPPSVPKVNFDLTIEATPRDQNNDGIDDGMIVKIPCVDLGAVDLVQVSLLDPNLPNGQQRIGYWRFDADQLGRLNYDRARRYIELDVNWDAPLRNSANLVFARISTGGDVSEGSSSILSRLSAEDDFSELDPALAPARSTALPENRSKWRPNR